MARLVAKAAFPGFLGSGPHVCGTGPGSFASGLWPLSSSSASWPGWGSESPWGHILVHPLKEAALLLSRLGARVELAALVGPILLHSPGDGGLATQAGHAPATIISGSAKPTPAVPHSRWVAQRAARRPQCRGRRPPGFQGAAISPQEEVTATATTLIELPALVGTLLPHSEQHGLLATVADHRITFPIGGGGQGQHPGGAVRSVLGLASLQVVRGLASWLGSSGGAP